MKIHEHIPILNNHHHAHLLGFACLDKNIMDDIKSGDFIFAPGFVDKGGGDLELIEISLIPSPWSRKKR